MTDDNKLQRAEGARTPATTRGSGVGLKGLHARIQQQKAAGTDDPLTKPFRIALLLDCSTSMYGTKIEHLRQAGESFVQHCSPSDTALGLRAFPPYGDSARQPLTCEHHLLHATILGLTASGGTPMAPAMEDVLTGMPVTRCVLVSDGEADSAPAALDVAGRYAEAGIPIDCLHIGSSSSGETTLQSIAERTGGKYIKFTDTLSFAGAFKYLTPGLYGMLTSGAIDAEELGAKELK